SAPDQVDERANVAVAQRGQGAPVDRAAGDEDLRLPVLLHRARIAVMQRHRLSVDGERAGSIAGRLGSARGAGEAENQKDRDIHRFVDTKPLFPRMLWGPPRSY